MSKSPETVSAFPWLKEHMTFDWTGKKYKYPVATIIEFEKEQEELLLIEKADEN